MRIHLLAGATSLALLMNVAVAEGTSELSVTTETTTNAPAAGTHRSTTTERTVDDDGNITEESRDYESDVTGTTSRSVTSTVESDGDKSSYREERTISPEGSSVVIQRRSVTTE